MVQDRRRAAIEKYAGAWCQRGALNSKVLYRDTMGTVDKELADDLGARLALNRDVIHEDFHPFRADAAHLDVVEAGCDGGTDLLALTAIDCCCQRLRRGGCKARRQRNDRTSRCIKPHLRLLAFRTTPPARLGPAAGRTYMLVCTFPFVALYST